MNITINYEIDKSRLYDLFFGHAGFYSDWIHNIVGNTDINSPTGHYITYDLATDNEGAGNGYKNVYVDDFIKGLTAMAKNSPQAFCNFISENDDDFTFDLAWQYVVFGEVIYA
jgi:hypothetical protein